jgi:hypothetical protein
MVLMLRLEKHTLGFNLKKNKLNVALYASGAIDACVIVAVLCRQRQSYRDKALTPDLLLIKQNLKSI